MADLQRPREIELISPELREHLPVSPPTTETIEGAKVTRDRFSVTIKDGPVKWKNGVIHFDREKLARNNESGLTEQKGEERLFQGGAFDGDVKQFQVSRERSNGFKVTDFYVTSVPQGATETKTFTVVPGLGQFGPLTYGPKIEEMLEAQGKINQERAEKGLGPIGLVFNVVETPGQGTNGLRVSGNSISQQLFTPLGTSKNEEKPEYQKACRENIAEALTLLQKTLNPLTGGSSNVSHNIITHSAGFPATLAALYDLEKKGTPFQVNTLTATGAYVAFNKKLTFFQNGFNTAFQALNNGHKPDGASQPPIAPQLNPLVSRETSSRPGGLTAVLGLEDSQIPLASATGVFSEVMKVAKNINPKYLENLTFYTSKSDEIIDHDKLEQVAAVIRERGVNVDLEKEVTGNHAETTQRLKVKDLLEPTPAPKFSAK
jgi:hypothetical protein